MKVLLEKFGIACWVRNYYMWAESPLDESKLTYNTCVSYVY